ncbi:hypothetical protein N7533_013441 [Penicillium manginii]|uniref:uncharacterized protein n=1 Tax=Penicillium manginii TaxID=203109 RepID=UPI0025485121|nr:uncharacterized protein N7533_013441 [Penicillium manginii]KAJ5732994.1 hypothetical protein N7533_013441 [Penicillium manginii]
MGIFSSHGSIINHTCPTPAAFAIEASEPSIGNSIYFYHLNMIISGACTALVVLIMFSPMFWHPIHLSKPRELIK